MRPLATVLFSVFTNGLFCQNIGINVTGATPHNSALLDINGSGLPANAQRGTLFPRISLVATDVPAPVVIPATSLFVYNTATAGTAPTNVTPGFYYWNSAAWVRLASMTDIPVIPQCPTGFAKVPGRNYCIEVNERPQMSWSDADTICLSLGFRLCHLGEWRDACFRQAGTVDNSDNLLPLQDMTGNEEWTWNIAPNFTVPTAGAVSCGNMSITSMYSGYPFRCCYSLLGQ